MQIALEALEDANDVARMEFSDENYYSEAINALRQALETDKQWVGLTELERFAALVADHERDRICKAIKEEDDYCVTEGDYMLDSDDCIAIAKGDWVRPDYSATAIRGMR
jgi:metal-responsive CopG/Arc/MetJ family transcriptional regulator